MGRPEFNKEKYYLGSVCLRGHEFIEGKSLRFRNSGGCVECRKAFLVKRLKRPSQKKAIETIKQKFPFDESKYTLGRLCPLHHSYHESEFTLRRISNFCCVTCQKEQIRRWYQSAKGKESRKRYRQSSEGKASNYRYKHSAKGKASDRKFQSSQRYRDQQIIYQHKRRARKRQANHNPYTLVDIQKRVEEFEGKCAYCDGKEDLTLDHFIPLSSGGYDCIENIVPACRVCNCSKNASNPITWFRKQQFFSEAKLNKILEVLSYDAKRISR